MRYKKWDGTSPLRFDRVLSGFAIAAVERPTQAPAARLVLPASPVSET